MSNKWASYRKVNQELKKDFACIPPYQCVNGKFIEDCYTTMIDGKSPYSHVSALVVNPGQRAYQMEYRYKKSDIFTPYIPVIEYATYDGLQANWICSYLALLPVVEAVMREWARINPTLSFNKMKGFGPKLIEYLKNNLDVFQDDRVEITNGHIEYLQYMLNEVIYLDFDTYADANFSDVMNRNLALHKLEGVIDINTGLHNVTRTLLLLDVIAEIYLMQDPQNWWQATFYATPETDTDFQLRWALYKKCAMFSVGPNDLLIIQNAFLNQISEERKKEATQALTTEIQVILAAEKIRAQRSNEP